MKSILSILNGSKQIVKTDVLPKAVLASFLIPAAFALSSSDTFTVSSLIERSDRSAPASDPATEVGRVEYMEVVVDMGEEGVEDDGELFVEDIFATT